MRRVLGRVLGGLGLAGAACFGWGLLESTLFTVRRVTVPVLPAGAEELRVLHVSDIHLTSRQHLKLDFIRSLSGLKPDLVINTGDNISDPQAIASLMAAANQLRFVPGVFVFGSNDYHAPSFKSPLTYVTRGRSAADGSKTPQSLPWENLREEFVGVGWKDLSNRRETLEVKGYRIDFRGTDDAHIDQDDYASVAGPADPGADLHIGVTHAPYQRVLDAMAADGMDIIFAGHTHGGQVTIPLYGALTTNSDLDTSRAKGLSKHVADDRVSYLHVSAGVGTSPTAPYRFACRPEVTLLTLVPRF